VQGEFDPHDLPLEKRHGGEVRLRIRKGNTDGFFPTDILDCANIGPIDEVVRPAPIQKTVPGDDHRRLIGVIRVEKLHAFLNFRYLQRFRSFQSFRGFGRLSVFHFGIGVASGIRLGLRLADPMHGFRQRIRSLPLAGSNKQWRGTRFAGDVHILFINQPSSIGQRLPHIITNQLRENPNDFFLGTPGCRQSHYRGNRNTRVTQACSAPNNMRLPGNAWKFCHGVIKFLLKFGIEGHPSI